MGLAGAASPLLFDIKDPVAQRHDFLDLTQAKPTGRDRGQEFALTCKIRAATIYFGVSLGLPLGKASSLLPNFSSNFLTNAIVPMGRPVKVCLLMASRAFPQEERIL